ncbi:tRNA(Ile)-lysidine synthase-like protein [Elsinoe fawcettii]|nr:tRNA(Ile)-lysidine synthase-like protein [Elsinoe fawcettii]
MLSQTGRTLVPLDILNARFHECLYPIWRRFRDPPRIAIALSGGSDSMALAYLCHKFQTSSSISKAPLTAFIVDHGVRPESHDEAQKARNILLSKIGPSRTIPAQHGANHFEKPVGIDVKILKLDWTTNIHPLRLPNFESLARTLRYQALAKACIENKISTLLLGHHADDQAETILSRIKGGYTGAGLQGIAAAGDIPECHGLYGCKSGRPRHVAVGENPSKMSIHDQRTVLAEDGGVQVFRPLLSFTKDELRQVCLQGGLKWVEDQTNHDKTLTIRNSVRSLLQEDRLPAALSTASLVHFATKRKVIVGTEARVVEGIFDACIVKLDISTGTANVQFPANIQGLMSGCDKSNDSATQRRIAALLMRRIITLVSPVEQIRLQSLEEPARLVMPFLFSEARVAGRNGSGTVTVGKSLLQVLAADDMQNNTHTRPITCQVSRAPPTVKDQLQQRKILIKATSRRSESFDWTSTKRELFDGRFWINLNYRRFNLIPGRRFSVRFLQSSDIESLNRDATKYTVWKPLKELLRTKAPGNLRFTLPAVVESYYTVLPTGDRKLVEKLVALPTLNWSSVGWQAWDKHAHREAWTWEVRYKKIDFGKGERHFFIA